MLPTRNNPFTKTFGILFDYHVITFIRDKYGRYSRKFFYLYMNHPYVGLILMGFGGLLGFNIIGVLYIFLCGRPHLRENEDRF